MLKKELNPVKEVLVQVARLFPIDGADKDVGGGWKEGGCYCDCGEGWSVKREGRDQRGGDAAVDENSGVGDGVCDPRRRTEREITCFLEQGNFGVVKS